ncbi:hypothetical protein HN937_25810, partial [Candidatus Poribacteria bacterium]|nr:hypothetical protein [Candidatus Poribacteria bacterium]
RVVHRDSTGRYRDGVSNRVIDVDPDMLLPENILEEDVLLDLMPEGYYYGTGPALPGHVRGASASTRQVTTAAGSFLHMGPARWNYMIPHQEVRRRYSTTVEVGDRLVFNLHNESEMSVLSSLMMDDDWRRRNNAPIHLVMPTNMRHERLLKQFQTYIMRRLTGEELIYGDAEDPTKLEIDRAGRDHVVEALHRKFPHTDWRVQWTEDYDQAERFVQEYRLEELYGDDLAGSGPRMPKRFELEFPGRDRWAVQGGELQNVGAWTLRADLLPGPEGTGEWTTVSQRPRFTRGPRRQMTGYEVHLQTQLPNPSRFEAEQSTLRRVVGGQAVGDDLGLSTLRSYEPDRKVGGWFKKQRRARGIFLRPGNRPPSLDAVGPAEIEDIYNVFVLAPDDLQRELDVFQRYTLGYARGQEDPIGVVLDVQQKWDNDRLFYKIHFGDRNTREVMYEYVAAYNQVVMPRHGLAMAPMIGQSMAAGINTLKKGLRHFISPELHALENEDDMLSAILEATHAWRERRAVSFRLNSGLASLAVEGMNLDVRPGTYANMLDEDALNPLSAKISGMTGEERQVLRRLRRLNRSSQVQGVRASSQRHRVGPVLTRGQTEDLTGIVRQIEAWDDGLGPVDKVELVRRIQGGEHRTVRSLLMYAQQELMARLDERNVLQDAAAAAGRDVVTPPANVYQRVFDWSDADVSLTGQQPRAVALGEILGTLQGVPVEHWGSLYDPFAPIHTTLEQSEYRHVAAMIYQRSRKGTLNESDIQDIIQDVELQAFQMGGRGAERSRIRGVDLAMARRGHGDPVTAFLDRVTADAEDITRYDTDDLDEWARNWIGYGGETAADTLERSTPTRFISDLHGDPGGLATMDRDGYYIGPPTMLDLVEDAFVDAGKSTGFIQPVDISQTFQPGNFGFAALQSDAGWRYGTTFEYAENLLGDHFVMRGERSFLSEGMRLSLPTLGRMKLSGFKILGAIDDVPGFFAAHEVMARAALESGVEELIASKTQQYLTAGNLDWAPYYSADDLQTIFNDQQLSDAASSRLQRQRRASNAVVQGMVLSEEIDKRQLADSTMDRYLREAYPGVEGNRRMVHWSMLRMAREVREAEPLLRQATSGYYRQRAMENLVGRALPGLAEVATGYVRKRHMGDRTNMVWGLKAHRVTEQRAAVRHWQGNLRR